MRALCAMAAMILTLGLLQAAERPAFPSGTYKGTATWRGPGDSSGSYAVEKTFADGTLRASYTWADSQARDEKHTVRFALSSAEPTFDIADEQGQVVGKGYCYDDACSYRATFGPVTVEESFRWSKNSMTVLGAKSGPGFSVVWKETLESR